MDCFKCKKLTLEYERTDLDHLELLRLRDSDESSPNQNEREIWDFIMDMVIKKRGDAARALAHHRERHTSALTQSASILTAALGESHILGAADFCAAFSGSLAL